MSLINNMLKDLEKRELSPRDTPPIALIYPQKNKSIVHLIKKMMLFVCLVLVFFLLAMLILSHQNKPKTMPLPLINKNPSLPYISNISSKMSEIKNEAWLKPVIINGATLQIKDNITEIIFLLNHVALYRLINNEMQNKLSVIIDHSELQAELPLANYENTGIQRMIARNVNGDTQIDIFISPNAVIKYINLNEENKNPELVIAVEQPMTSSLFLENHSPTLLKKPVTPNALYQEYQDALNAAEMGQYQTAITQLFSVIKMNPTYKDARVSLAALLMDQNQYLQAKMIVDEGLRLNPDYIPYVELKARSLVNEGKIKKALSLLQSASPAFNENTEYYALTAALYQQNNNDRLAIDLYKQLLTLNSQNSNWWLGLGISLEKLTKNKEAAYAYKEAIKIGHLNPESLAYIRNHLQSLRGESHDAF